MRVRISNVNVLVEYPDVIFDLQFLSEELPKGLVSYDPWAFPAVKYWWKYYLQIYRTGKVIIHGLKTLDYEDIVAEMTQELERVVGKLPQPKTRITLLSASVYLDEPIDIEKLAEMPGTVYTPEFHIQGLTMTIAGHNVLVYPSGFVSIFGLKSKQQLDRIVQALSEEVKKWPKLTSRN